MESKTPHSSQKLFLTVQNQQVVVDRATSDEVPVISGVPQVLGTLLPIIY